MSRSSTDLRTTLVSEALTHILRGIGDSIVRLSIGGTFPSFFEETIEQLRSHSIRGSRLTILYDSLGGLLRFRALFGDRLDEESSSILHGRVQELHRGLEQIDSEGLRDELDKSLTADLSRMLEEYQVYIKETSDSINDFGRMNDDEFLDVRDDIDFMTSYRDTAECVSLAADSIGHPHGVNDWLASITSHDAILRTILIRAVERAPSLFEGGSNLESHERLEYPPEVCWWDWLRLEERQKRPLSDIFGFDPEEVRRKLASIRPINS